MRSKRTYRKVYEGNIQKAQKNDISIGMETDVDTYYSLLTKTYEKQGLPTPVSKRFLSKMIDMILSNGSGKMWIARTSSGEPAAVEMVIWDNKRAYRWQGVLDPEFKATGATSLLLYEIFNDLAGRGILRHQSHGRKYTPSDRIRLRFQSPAGAVLSCLENEKGTRSPQILVIEDLAPVSVRCPARPDAQVALYVTRRS